MSSLLIVRLSALGDIIHTLPAAHALRAGLDQSVRIGWVVERPYRDLVARVAPVDAVFAVATRSWRRSPLSRSTRQELRAFRTELESFDSQVAVDFQGLLKSAIVAWSSKARRRIGFGRNSLREKQAAWFYTEAVEVSGGQHVVDINVSLARQLGAREEKGRSFGDLRSFASDPSGSFASFEGFVVLLPGAGWKEKMWPASHFAQLARRLEQRSGIRSLVLWGPGERPLAEEIAASSPAVIAPASNLEEMTFCLSRARLAVGGDTGPLHAAAAMDVPVVGLYGPTDPNRNGPYGQVHRCLETFTMSRNIHDISVEQVEDRVLKELG